ncbi:MAG TPA: hypothetical protein VFS21_13110 [Roseiflexaceae bacterium]|nr:hypothetical protein [Roseiflexaceae bacterium]
MPPHSRAQRKRQAPRQQPRPAGSAPVAPEPVDVDISDLTMEGLAGGVQPGYAVSAPAGSAAASKAARRTRTRVAPAPVDYTSDYADARKDLRLIVLWAALLFIAMIALKFSGVV